MKGSPIFPGFDTDSGSYEFDPQADFAQFLKEARRHVNGKEVMPTQSAKKQQLNVQEKCKKKTWKAAFFSLWKTSEKKKTKQSLKESSTDGHSTSPKRRGHVSGPVCHGSGPETDAKRLFPASGPLLGLFHAKKREGKDIPYVSLDMLNRPQYDAKTYGPVYLVS